MYESALWYGVILLILIVIIETCVNRSLLEGFLVPVGESARWASWVPRRGDISLTKEQDGYIRDLRYLATYTDIQRLGVDHDFCRMVVSETDRKDMFFACALGGTDGLSTVKYRTPSTKNGFQVSRDDYMRDILQEGRTAYCRILKTGPNTFEAKGNTANDTSFSTDLVIDANPPPAIQTLLTFYDGIVFWLRMRDDLLDYAQNLMIANVGAMQINELPQPITQGLSFNGMDQYLRLGETSDLSFGEKVKLRSLRATSFWVYFDEFTNNATIYDFGNGAGKDNVVVKIIGRGNPGLQTLPPVTCMSPEQSTVPTEPSGPSCTEEVSPQVAMATSRGDVNRWDCPTPELFGRIMEPLHRSKAPKQGEVTNADLLYEIWDPRQRKVHIQVKQAFPLREWVHIVITTTSMDPTKPGLAIYRNGKVVHREESSFLPQTDTTSNNYIGRSNWANATSPYENADELFKGQLFDVRGYQTNMSPQKIKDTYAWGRELLGLNLKESATTPSTPSSSTPLRA